jgi:protein-S-isoprenylcysteine O-methyltransferase Ste14
MAYAQEKSFPSRVHRTNGSSTLGVSLFIILRTLDPFLQYGILRGHLGIRALPNLFGGRLASFTDNEQNWALGPYQLLILGMSVGTTVKQVYWSVFLSQQELNPVHGIIISLFNTTFNCLNTFYSLWPATSATTYDLSWTSLLHSPSVVAGVFLYSSGILTEIISEIQRSRFKRDPANAGLPYSGGLFSLARNINYTGYLLWRTGFALASAGPIWAIVVFAFFFRNFAVQSVPELDNYCQKRVPPCRKQADMRSTGKPGYRSGNEYLTSFFPDFISVNDFSA